MERKYIAASKSTKPCSLYGLVLFALWIQWSKFSSFEKNSQHMHLNAARDVSIEIKKLLGSKGHKSHTDGLRGGVEGLNFIATFC